MRVNCFQFGASVISEMFFFYLFSRQQLKAKCICTHEICLSCNDKR